MVGGVVGWGGAGVGWWVVVGVEGWVDRGEWWSFVPVGHVVPSSVG